MLQPVPPSLSLRLPAWLDLFLDSGAEVCYQLPGYIHWLGALRVLYYVCNTALFGNLSSKLVNLPSFLSTLILIMMVMLMTVWLRDLSWSYSNCLAQQAAKRRSCRTREAEYIALSACINEVVWFQAFLRELGLQVPLPVPFHGVNRSADKISI